MSEEEQGRKRKGSFSFSETILDQLKKLAEQRKLEKETELQRQALKIGAFFLSIEGGPDRGTGLYGNWDEAELAENLRPWVIISLDWLNRHGHSISSSSPELTSLLTHLAQSSTPFRNTPSQHNEDTKAEAIISANSLQAMGIEDDPIL